MTKTKISNRFTDSPEDRLKFVKKNAGKRVVWSIINDDLEVTKESVGTLCGYDRTEEGEIISFIVSTTIGWKYPTAADVILSRSPEGSYYYATKVELI